MTVAGRGMKPGMQLGGERMDEALVLRIAAAAGVPEPTAAQRASGWSLAGEVWRVRAPGQEYALRLYADGHEVSMQAESAILRATQECGLPVPGVRAAGTHEGRAYLLTDWCTGETVLEALSRLPQAAELLGRSFGRAHADVHRIQVPAGLRQAGAAGDRLLHLDFHLLNVLTDGRSVTAILDWENARAGDPREDVARTVSVIQIHAPQMAGGGAGRLALRSFLHGYFDGYRDLGGWALEGMAPYYAWAGEFAVRDLAPKAGGTILRRAERWARWWRHRARA